MEVTRSKKTIITTITKSRLTISWLLKPIVQYNTERDLPTVLEVTLCFSFIHSVYDNLSDVTSMPEKILRAVYKSKRQFFSA